MDAVDPFQELQLPPNATVALKEGLNIDELTSGSGTIFEVDTDQIDSFQSESKEPVDDQSLNSQFWNSLDISCSLGGDYCDDEGTPFSHLEKTMIDLTGDNGVMKRVVEVGIGPVVPKGGVARVHYNGYLEYADEPYDSTRLRNCPLKVRLGSGEIIPGLDIGIATMKKSEKARFLVKPDYAFGKMGCPPRIPPDASILFEVELLSCIDDKAADSYNSMSEESKQKMMFDEIVEVAKSEKEIGNEAFDCKKYGKAASHYSKGIRVLEPAHLQNDQEEETWRGILIKLYLNLAMADLKQCKSSLAVTHCRRVLELDSRNVKAVFRLGQAYMQLGDWDRSKQNLLNAVQLAPNNIEIRQELEKLNQKVQQFELLERGMYSKMFDSKQQGEVDNSQAMKPAGAEEHVKSSITESLRESYKEKIESFKEKSDQREIVLPSGTNPDEVNCIVKLAEDAGLLVETADKEQCSYSVRITKPLKTSKGQ